MPRPQDDNPTRWDAGEAGCGRLATELHARVRSLRPGERLEVTAPGAGARVDIPAWCRLTGQKLVSSEHPTYIIERVED